MSLRGRETFREGFEVTVDILSLSRDLPFAARTAYRVDLTPSEHVESSNAVDEFRQRQESSRMRFLRQFATCTRAQDLVEYVLLLALAVIATTAMLVTAGESLSGVWNAPVLGSADSTSTTHSHRR